VGNHPTTDETKTMTTNDRRAEDRQALERLLDIYGADRTRWPARERLRFASIIAEDKAAARLLAEADALDRLLDRAPRTSEVRMHALKERIVAAAVRSGHGGLAVVPTGALPGQRLRSWARRPALGFSGSEWPAAAVLAASLVLGVLLGSAGTFDTTVQKVAEVTGFSTTADTSQLALGDDVDGQAPADEDLL
jgi:hypothetical protein